ncbi:cilia- and flagella-associated protein 65 isoform X2 [Motacilla alba alba]|uniref:cilia- and flagella-associated protein 65 isoform X2 n=1 Tax=Motacilla alba alba TaxID=1094192 RepID=UPI0018D4EF24|nr:cilia- and flagella-associated protein 65 isoform X2 [Motacilla alba alba]
MLAQVHDEPQNSDSFRKSGYDRKMSGGAKSATEVSARGKKKKKVIFWGIEVPETLSWHDWELGKEAIKHLTLKNVHGKAQKLSYRAPSTPFFCTVFPQPITLNPGMSVALPVVFRPSEKRDYEDNILFRKAEGDFSVTLHAMLPRFCLSIPATVQLPICAVYSATEAAFPVCNIGDLVSMFAWETSSPFSMNPECGTLNPGAKCMVKVVFMPEVAGVHYAAATCWFGGEVKQKRTIMLKALAKYPCLCLSVTGKKSEGVQPGKCQDVLCFGSVAVGTTVEKSVEIFNVSVVDAPCRIEQAGDLLLRGDVFSCDMSSKVVPAKGKLVLCIRFQPQVVGEHSTGYFTITSAGCRLKTVLKVVGSCKGPSVSLQSSVDFDWVNLGESLMRTLKISNASDVPAYYQFDIDCKGSVFSLDRPCGVLEGATTLRLKVVFRPAHPMNYHRRVACLVHYQEPLYVDFFGTCHSDTAKPATLQKRHLSWYRTNMVRGLTFYPPDILSEMLKDGKLQMDEKGALMLAPEISEDQPPKEYFEPNAMAEYFYDGVSSDLALFPVHVSVSPREYDFGCCVPPQKSLSLCVTNHTKGNIIVAWTPNHGSVFHVRPEVCDVPPLKSSTFHVFCRPTQINSFFAAELEGFAVYKVMRHYSNIESDATICPSWCLTVRLRAHTYEAKQEHIIPQYILDVPKTFPPVVCDTDTYCSMLLSNTNTSLITFSVNQTACPCVLVKPSLGHVIPGGHQIFFLSTHPVNTVLQQHVLPLELNSYPAYTKEIVLQSCGQSLLLLLEGNGILYFKPFQIGASSTRMYTIKNCTRLPMVFTWRIRQSDSKILSVSPTSGILQPYEAVAQAWTFTPNKKTKFVLRAMVFVKWKSPEPVSPKDVHYVLRVIGEGALGTIRAQQEYLDLGNVLVGDQKSCSIVLLNDGICTVNYILSVEQLFTGPYDPEEVRNDLLALELEHSRGTIPARSKAFVRIKVRPARRLQYTWTIKYDICTSRDLASAEETQEALCYIVAAGVYPTLRITDACTTGTASSNSKVHIWKRFSLDTLNEFLERDPTPGELTYKVPTRHSTCLIPPVYTPLLLDFDFGSAPVGSEPTNVMLLLENKGVVPVDWAFLFPSDQKMDIECWAEDVDFTPQELHQMRIQDNQLFSVSPKSGTLLPGMEKSVQLSHRHDFIGTDRLPVLLKISYGHEILLTFSGVTVEHDQRYVHFASTKHVFTPIAVGHSQPPTQIYKLYNGGSMPVTFEVQLDNIVKIKEKNFQHPVFVCLTPRGEIPPGESGHIEWIFSPLEAKTYTVDVLIHILEGESTQITFQGVGYNPNIVGEAATSRQFFNSAVIPGSAKLTVPGQAATLSHNRICLGNIPDCTKAGRLVFLNNISKSKAVVFTWQINSTKEMVLEIAPESGVVQPGESIPCFITLQPTRNPYFCRINLVCEVYIQESLVQYERDLHEWEKEKERQAVEFTITEKDLETKKKLTSPSVRLSNSTETENLSKSSAGIRKYKTLPPIKSYPAPSQPPGHIERGLPLDKDTSQVWVKPEPPTPLSLHLDVSARSYAIEDFLSNFALDFRRYFLSRPFSTQPSDSKLMDGSGHRNRTDVESKRLSLAAASKQELQIVTDILTGVIRSLLEDGRFQRSVRKIQDEPIPYFSQFQSAQSAELQDSRQGSTIPSSVSASTDLDLEKDGERKKKSEEASSSDLLESCKTFHYQQLRVKEIISRQPAVANLVELVLENTLQNIMIEASRGEVVLTAQPRVIALPPIASQRITRLAPPPSRV